MKKTVFLTLLLLTNLLTNAQVVTPYTYKAEVSNPKPNVGDEVEIIFTFSIINDWYMYSSDFDPDLGPTVTTFKFENDASYKTIGGIKAINSKKKYDDIWEGEYTYFVGTGVFKQKIKILSENVTIKGETEFQICSETDGKCIPFLENFELNIKATKKVNEVVKDNPKIENQKTDIDTTQKTDTATVKKIENEDSNTPKFSKVSGDFAIDEAGADYVLVEGKWYKVPLGNSPKFYQKYLTLGGTHAE